MNKSWFLPLALITMVRYSVGIHFFPCIVKRQYNKGGDLSVCSPKQSDNTRGSQLYRSLINSGAPVFKLNKLVLKGLLLQYCYSQFL